MKYPELKHLRIDDPFAAKAHAWFRQELQKTPPGLPGEEELAKEFRDELLSDPLALSRFFRQLAGMRGQMRVLKVSEDWRDKIAEIVAMLSHMVVYNDSNPK